MGVNMQRSDLCAISLDQAWYCESCRVVVNDPLCSLCDSRDHTQRLAPWLDWEPAISVQLNGVVVSISPIPQAPPRRLGGTGGVNG